MKEPSLNVDVSEAPFWQNAAIFVVCWIIKLWQATIRFKCSEETARMFRSKGPMIVLIWHNRIFITPMLKVRYRKNDKMSGLISPSKDGAALAAMFKFFGVSAIRGSSKRRGALAIRELVDELKSGGDICITPDGPRGPMYHIKGGALKVAELSGANMLIIRSRYRLFIKINKAWDKFMLPLPFSTVEVEAAALKPYSELQAEADRAGIKLETHVESLLGK